MCARAGVRGCVMNELTQLAIEMMSDDEKRAFENHKQFLANYLSEHGELALLALAFINVELSKEMMRCLAKKS